MTKFRTVLLAAISALLMFATAYPAAAQSVSASGRIYNDITKMWETPDGTPIIHNRSGGMVSHGSHRQPGAARGCRLPHQI